MRIILIFLMSISFIYAKELEKVSVQLQWLDQFQFAGYYMAKEKGFYKDIGLDVEIKKYKKELKPIDEVTSKRATYGIGRPSLILDRSKGKKIVLLSALFQSSPLVLVARKDSNISTIDDFVGKTIMATFDDTSIISLKAMLNRKQVHISNLNIIPYSYDINDLVSGKTDLMTAYITNQVYTLKELGIEYNIFNPNDYGFGVYADLLFTTEDEVKNHHHRTENFRDATLKGYEYAFHHIEETIALIKAKYNSQNKSIASLRYEAEESKKLAYLNTKKIGILKASKIQRIYDIYHIMGLVHKEIDLEKFILSTENHKHNILYPKEEQYLKDKKEITMCVLPDSLPYSKIKAGKYIGIGADYINLIADILHTKFTLVTTSSSIESLNFIKEKRCDILPIAIKTPSKEKYLSFSKAFLSSSLVIATTNEKHFIPDIKNVLDKKFGVQRGHSNVEQLKILYPNIKLVEYRNNRDGLKQVSNGNIYGYIGDIACVSYALEKYQDKNIKVSGSIGKSIEVGMGVHSDDKLLLSILNKAIENISEKEVQDIYNDWINITYQKAIDYIFIYKVLGIFLMILLTITFFLVKQNRLKQKIESLNFKLNQKVSTQVLEIQRSSHMFELIFNTVQNGLAIMDLKSNFILVNKAYENITGHSKEELYASSCIEMTSPDMIEEAKKVLSVFLQKGYYGSYEKQCIVKNGRVIDVILDLIMMPDKKTILMVMKDITKKKEYERKKKLQEKQLFHQSKLVQMGEMLSMIAHQWRQPLGAISSSSIDIRMKIELELYDLEEKQSRNEFLKYLNNSLDNIESFTQSLTTTIDEFRDFYKKDETPKLVNITDSIQKSLNIIKGSLKINNIQLTQKYNHTKKVPLFSGEFMQVVLNIFKNAEDNFLIKEIKNPNITIATFDYKNGVGLDICDNGGGIPETIIDKIFEPYFSTKNEKNGTGLGLYMSKMIIEEHHKGKLSVLNTRDGVCFKIEINDEDRQWK